MVKGGEVNVGQRLQSQTFASDRTYVLDAMNSVDPLLPVGL